MANKENICRYYAEMGLQTVITGSPLRCVATALRSPGKAAVVTESRAVYGLAKLFGTKHAMLKNADTAADQYFAFKDTVELLMSKGVPVFFFNRVGLMKGGFDYSNSAVHRMKARINFPKVLSNPEKYSKDLYELYGDKYSPDYVRELGKIPQIVKIGNQYCHEDCAEKYVNVRGGKRITVGAPDKSEFTVHFFGRCGAFGYAVEDAETIPSFLQRILNSSGFPNVRVVNHGLWGGEDALLDHNYIQESIGYKQGDVVVFYRKQFAEALTEQLVRKGMIFRDLTPQWHEFPESKWCFFDSPGHMNAIGYRHAAELIFSELKENGFTSFRAEKKQGELSVPSLKTYLKTHDDIEFSKEIHRYTESVLQEYPLDDRIQKCGAIVMNCNPFTKGHRYLIEYAASHVDRLYVFVVEEDKSFFKLEHRLEMVRRGTEDLSNVVVIPSGRFIISAYTFPEYFMKDYVREKEFDVSKDITLFAKYIAPPLRISVRFAGEEPFDPVTQNYNQSMKKLLPEYGIEFQEIQRITTDGEHIINATEVRKLIGEKKTESIRDYVPETTMHILEEYYL